MAVSALWIDQRILDQLAKGEKRILGLTVSVRNSLDRSTPIKGDLSAMVKASVRRLLLSRVIVETEGLYALAQSTGANAAANTTANAES